MELMKVRKKNTFGVKQILAGMVVDYNVCMRISSQWPKSGGLFDAPWANMVARWCIEHAAKYDKPIGRNLTNAFEQWVEGEDPAEEMVAGVEQFLISAEDQWEQSSEVETNSDYILDQADQYFNQVRLKEVMDVAEDLVSRGKTKQAEELLQNYPSVRLGPTESYVDPGRDWDWWRKAFDDDSVNRTLISYPEFMHKTIGRWLKRDQLVSFMAPDKSGKSVYLLDLAVRALRSRCRIAYFDVGDNSIEQVMQRFGARVSRKPSIDNYKQQVDVPVSGLLLKDGDRWVAEVETEVRKFKRSVTATDGFNAFRKISRKVHRCRLQCFPNSTMSARGIESILTTWSKEDDWVPDVVVIDYADILAAVEERKDTLDQIDDTWRRLRRISQKFHCLVVTATQASAAAYNDKAGVLRKQHFSGRKTKLAHVNGMIGINTSDDDRQKGVSRLNWIVRREGRYSEKQQIAVAGSWEWYDPCVVSLDRVQVDQQNGKQE